MWNDSKSIGDNRLMRNRVAPSTSQQSNASSCLIGYGRQEEEDEQEDYRLTDCMDDENDKFNRANEDDEIDSGAVSASTNNRTNSKSNGINRNHIGIDSIQHEYQGDDDDDDLVLKGRSKPSNKSYSNSIDHDSDHSEPEGTFAGLEQYLKANPQQELEQKEYLEGNPHCDPIHETHKNVADIATDHVTTEHVNVDNYSTSFSNSKPKSILGIIQKQQQKQRRKIDNQKSIHNRNRNGNILQMNSSQPRTPLFANRIIANDDIGRSYRGKQKTTSMQTSATAFASTTTPAHKLLRRSINSSHKRMATNTRMALPNRHEAACTPTPDAALTQAQKLAAATQSSTILIRKKRRSSSAPNSNSYSYTTDMRSATKTFDCLSNKKTLTSWPKWNKSKDHLNHDQDHIEDMNTVPSFGPSFLSNKKNIPRMDHVADEDDEDLEQGVAYSVTKHQAMATPPRYYASTVLNVTANISTTGHRNAASDHQNLEFRTSPQPAITRNKVSRKRKRNKGPLSRILHSIRGSVEADRARFHSGNYPYRQPERRRHDVNDPRNRAETIMDVTVMSHPTPLGGSTESAFVVGYVHQHIKNDSMIQTMRIVGRSRHFRHAASELKFNVDNSGAGIDHLNEKNDDLYAKAPAFSHICFTRDAFLDLGIGIGSQVRIYNTRIISHEVLSSVQEIEAISKEVDVQSTVVCTHLCEVYPDELTPLPWPS